MISPSVIIAMEKLDPSFNGSRQFSPKTYVDACKMVGTLPNGAVFRKYPKVSRGIYCMDTTVTPISKPEKSVTKTKVSVIKKKETTVQFESPVAVSIVHDIKVSRNSSYNTVPVLDSNYVPFGDYKDIERVIKSRKFYPIFITGHSGNGKSSQILHICAKHEVPLIRLSMTKATGFDELIGSKSLVDGNIVIVEGVVLTALRSGSLLLLDELDCADSGAIMCLQGILEGKSFFSALTGEWIDPAPGFNIIATANTKGKGSDDGRYIGTNVLNEAFLERFPVTFEQDFPGPSIEKRMVLNWMKREDCVDDVFADELCRWADATRRTFKDGAIDDLISSRRLEHIVGAYAIYGNKRKSVELCVNRFDTLTKDAFVQLFDKIATEQPVEPTDAVVS